MFTKFTISVLQSAGWHIGVDSAGRADWSIRGAFIIVHSVLSLLYLSLLANSCRARKYLQILASFDANTLGAFTKPNNTIYMAFSIHTNDCYIGETQRAIMQRWPEEMNAAESASESGTGTQFALRVGRFGAQFFSVLPLVLLGPATKSDRLKAETAAIKHFNANLNSKPQHRLCKRPGNRARARLAGRVGSRRRRVDISRVQKVSFARFIVRSVDDPSICAEGVSLDALMRRIPNGQIVAIDVQRGQHDVTSYSSLCRDFVLSRASVSALRSGDQRVVSQVKRAHGRKDPTKLVLHIGSHPHAWRKLLVKQSLSVLLDLFARAADITNRRLRENAQSRIRAAISNGIGVRKLPSCVLCIPFSHDISKHMVTRAMRFAIDKLPFTAMVRDWLNKQVRVVFSPRRSIAQLLVNNRHFARSANAQQRPSCNCQDAHFCTRLESMQGAVRTVGVVNASSVPIPSRNQSQHDVVSALQLFVQQFSVVAKQDGLLDGDAMRCALMAVRRSGAAVGVLSQTVSVAKQSLGNAVVSQLDKNRGSLLAECPVSAWQRLNKAFWSCPHFSAVPMSANEALRTIEADFNSQQFAKLATWLPGSLPYAYTDPKNSDLSRSRGIVSYFKHPARMLFKRVSSVLTFLLANLPSDIRHFTMFQLDQLPADLQTMQAQLTRDSNTRFLAFQTDVCEMFTNLRHKDIVERVRWLFDVVSTTAPGRRQYRDVLAVQRFGKKRDVRWGRAYNESWLTLSFADILRVVQFDLRSVFFTAGDCTLRQTHGAPIGGFISAFYGNLICASREHSYCASLQAAQWFLAAKRCQDDVFAVVAYQQNEPTSLEFALHVRDDFMCNRVYTGGLTVKSVPIEDQRAKFVGSSVFVGDRSLHAAAFNRNWADILQLKQTFPRFHSWTSYADVAAKRGAFLGSLCRIEKQSTFDVNAVIECGKLLVEFETIGYPRSFLDQTLTELMMREQAKRCTRREHTSNERCRKTSSRSRSVEERVGIWRAVRTFRRDLHDASI